jgi:16S rRNA (cytidine1402-2'-O)-methyltransferase
MDPISFSYQPQELRPGLYVVATPIGNLGDITLRALDILSRADYILAEDTRVTAKLLQRYGITTKMTSCREAMPLPQFLRVADQVIRSITDGGVVALVSDAGTPGISDPGNRMVAAVRRAGLQALPIPGSSAMAAILSVTGLPIQSPLFLGFLPKKKGHQTLVSYIDEVLGSGQIDAVVLYESAERLSKVTTELLSGKTKKAILLGRELTKSFETIQLITAADALPAVKGELVLVVVPHQMVC